MPNRRLTYATAGVFIAPEGTTSLTTSHLIHGAQTCSMDANFNTERIFEIGQSETYETIEEVPDVNVTLSKVLDGYCPMYLLATRSANTATLAGRADVISQFSALFYPDDFSSASGTPLTQVDVSGCYVGSVGYNFAVDDNFTEDLSLVSNSRVWRTSNFTFSSTAFDGSDTPLAITGSGGINRREDLIYSPTAGGTILPPDVAGITSSGTNERTNGVHGASIQSIRVSVDMGREGVRELGQKKDYYKFRSPVVTVSTVIEAIAKTGDLVNARDDQDNLTDRQIRIKTREGLVLDLGSKNKLDSVSMGGFDAGGGNANVTYNFSNGNFFTVQHPQDPNTALRP